MNKLTAPPFALEGALGPKLDQLLAYWKGLLRGEAEMPFADDVDPTKVAACCADMFLIGVFEKPRRFRLDVARTPNAPVVEQTLVGRFLDEVELGAPLQFLRAQAEATVESRAPTLYRDRPVGSELAYARLLAPAWGEGSVRLLVGAIAWR